MSTSDDTTRKQFDEIVANETKPLAETFWDVRDLYREHRTREQLNALFHYGHFIPMGRGSTRKYVDENYPGWSWNQLVTVSKAAAVFVGRGGSPAKCNDEVEEFYFDSETAWLVVWSDGRKTCGTDAPGLTKTASTGREHPIFDLATGKDLEQPSADDDVPASSRTTGTEARESPDVELLNAAPEEGTATKPTGDACQDILPWKILAKHQDCAIMEKFRTILKHKNGEPTADQEEEKLHDWLEALSELNSVVAYDPEVGPNAASAQGGFYYVDRIAEDTWIVRDPALGRGEPTFE